jgi:hypothetical protein
LKETGTLKNFLIIGNGQISRHIQFYFNYKTITYSLWTRKDSFSQLIINLKESEYILIATSDKSIKSVFDSIKPFLLEKHRVIHFSGALYFKEILGIHPLMSFSSETAFRLKDYELIPLVIEKTTDASVKNILKENFNNPILEIEKEMKSLYHSYCSMVSNCLQMLIMQVRESFESKLQLDGLIILPIVKQIVNQSLSKTPGKLSGPLARGDWETVEKQIQSLENDPLQKILLAFIDLYNQQLAENFQKKPFNTFKELK